MPDLEDIYKALLTIRETCAAHKKCKDCPLRDWEGFCGVADPEKDPCKWDVHDIESGRDSFFVFEEDEED